jgi:hypothetical protein
MWRQLAGESSISPFGSSTDLAAMENDESPPIPIEDIWEMLEDGITFS